MHWRIFERTPQGRTWLAVAFFVLFSGSYALVRVFVYPPSSNELTYVNNNFSLLGLNIPANLQFCGERIPSNNIGIRRALEKEFYSNSYWKAHSKLLFQKAQRWFPYIEPVLREERVPDDFKYLAVIESHLSNVTSPAGAAGFWQLVPFSARNYGLEVNAEVDERYHLEKATRAACKHLREAYAVFGNWTLAAAAYNRGIGGIQKALAGQKASNYFDLLLNPETGSFVYRILAYKTLLANPSHFGLHAHKLNNLPRIPVRITKIDTTVRDLGKLARHLGCSKVVLKVFNPWLLANSLPNAAHRTYEIRIPKNLEADYTAYMKDLVPEDWGLTPEAEEAVLSRRANADSAVMRVKRVDYIVRIDEPLSNLAKFLKVKEEDLRVWNNLGLNDNAVKGQTLVVNYYQDLTSSQ